jgi:hypothetical protein
MRPTAQPSADQPCVAAPVPQRWSHVIVVMMENERAGALDRRSAPYEAELTERCATATHWVAPGAISLPNYLALTSGTTAGLRHNYPPWQRPQSQDNLFRQIRTAGGTVRTYAESAARPCDLAETKRYNLSHNPAVYYTAADDRASCARDDVPMGTPGAGVLAADLATDRLPTLAFLVPDMIHDTHNSDVPTGDRWLHSWLPRILDSPAYTRGETVVLVLWDEYTPAPNILIAPSIHPGTVVAGPSGHCSALRAIEDMFGLSHLGCAASAADLRTRARF